MMSPKEGEPTKPFGVANTHATFLRNFIELATVVSDDAPIPKEAVLISLQVPAAVLPRILETIKRTVATLAAETFSPLMTSMALWKAPRNASSLNRSPISALTNDVTALSKH